jgi:hypothetical protein
LVSGGSQIGYLQASELYDPVTGRWTRTGDLSVARGLHTATLLPDRTILAAGGFGGPQSNAGLDSAERYQSRTGVWAGAGTMSSVRSAHTATLLRDGSVLVAGGGDNTDIRTAEIFTLGCRTH